MEEVHALAQHIAVRQPADAHGEIAAQALVDDRLGHEIQEWQHEQNQRAHAARPSQWSSQKVSRFAADSKSTSLPTKAKSYTSMSAITVANSDEASSSGQNGLE